MQSKIVAEMPHFDLYLSYIALISIYNPHAQIFWDLMTQYEDSRGQLHIMESEVLGKGGFGFVCRGDLMPEVRLWG